jgi:hypothetical protein
MRGSNGQQDHQRRRAGAAPEPLGRAHQRKGD